MIRCLALFVVTCALSAPAYAKVDMFIGASVAPNKGASSHWDAYVRHAFEAMAAGQRGAGGTRLTSPAAFALVESAHAGQVLVSSGRSWDGFADPPAPFEREHGCRLHFPLRILGNGTKVRLADLHFDLQSSDAMKDLAMQGSLAEAAYTAWRVGIDYGPDGQRGSEDDVRYDSGQAATMPVDEILYIGVGNAAEASSTSRGDTTQAKLDGVLAALEASKSYRLTMTYRLVDGKSGEVLATASKHIKVSPRPTSAPWQVVAAEAGTTVGSPMLLAAAGVAVAAGLIAMVRFTRARGRFGNLGRW